MDIYFRIFEDCIMLNLKVIFFVLIVFFVLDGMFVKFVLFLGDENVFIVIQGNWLNNYLVINKCLVNKKYKVKIFFIYLNLNLNVYFLN